MLCFPIFGCGLLVLVVMALLVLVGVYLLLRRSDPQHAFRRTAGIGLLVLSGFVLATGSLAFVATLASDDVTTFTSHWEPNSSNSESSYAFNVGSGALSLWLFLSGAAVAFGYFLFAKRFSLRSLLIAVLLVALVASLPHLTVQPHDTKVVIEARIHRVLTVEERTSLEQAFSKESLCNAVSDPVKKALPCSIADALRNVELQPQTTGGMESEGMVGVRLTLRFSHELEQEQVVKIFDELSNYVQKAMPSERGP